MKLARWFLKKINSPWHDRLLAEDALLEYGLFMYKDETWVYKHQEKQILATIGHFYKNNGRFLFACRFHKVYGEFQHHYIPLKNNYTYSCDDLIKIFSKKTHERI